MRSDREDSFKRQVSWRYPKPCKQTSIKTESRPYSPFLLLSRCLIIYIISLNAKKEKNIKDDSLRTETNRVRFS